MQPGNGHAAAKQTVRRERAYDVTCDTQHPEALSLTISRRLWPRDPKGERARFRSSFSYQSPPRRIFHTRIRVRRARCLGRLGAQGTQRTREPQSTQARPTAGAHGRLDACRVACRSSRRPPHLACRQRTSTPSHGPRLARGLYEEVLAYQVGTINTTRTRAYLQSIVAVEEGRIMMNVDSAVPQLGTRRRLRTTGSQSTGMSSTRSAPEKGGVALEFTPVSSSTRDTRLTLACALQVGPRRVSASPNHGG